MTRERPLPDDDLSRWIRSLPETWAQTIEPRPAEELDLLASAIVGGTRHIPSLSRTRRRRFGIAAVVVIGAGGIAGGAAALMRGEQPTRPNDSVLCRAAATMPSDAVALAAGRDPVAACAAAWLEGDEPFPPNGGVPELAGCVNAAGTIEVIPGPPEICGELGLVLLEWPLSPENESILALQERLVAEINSQPCASVADVQRAAATILADEGFAGWAVEVLPGWEQADCAKVGVRAVDRLITIFNGV